MVTSVRHKPVHHNAYMKIYSMLEEMNLPLGFHAGYNWNEQSMGLMNKFISVHAIGFVFHNMVHLTNWVLNGLGERCGNANLTTIIPTLLLKKEYAVSPEVVAEAREFVRRHRLERFGGAGEASSAEAVGTKQTSGLDFPLNSSR